MSHNKSESSWKAELERVHQVKQEVFDRIRRVEQKMAEGSLDEVLQKMKAFNDRFVIQEKLADDNKHAIKSLTLRVQALEKTMQDEKVWKKAASEAVQQWQVKCQAEFDEQDIPQAHAPLHKECKVQ